MEQSRGSMSVMRDEFKSSDRLSLARCSLCRYFTIDCAPCAQMDGGGQVRGTLSTHSTRSWLMRPTSVDSAVSVGLSLTSSSVRLAML